MADVLDILEKQGIVNQIQPLFISIDPWRDTVAQVRGYVKGQT
jgi:cytochrome oxidase Cu insertion factor (SCO1/SenC/PrrC family)